MTAPNSRMNQNQPQFLVNSQSQPVGSQVSQVSQNKVNFYNPIHSRANSTNVYYQNPNGFIVNPIESKYVPMINGPINQSVPVFAPQNMVVRRVGVENGVQGFRGANSVQTYNVQRV